jgi:hypothetical protein
MMLRVLSALVVAVIVTGVTIGAVFALLRPRTRWRREMLSNALSASIEAQAATARANYRLAQLVIRRLEMMNRVDDLTPFLDPKEREENERLIEAFYQDQLPKGK